MERKRLEEEVENAGPWSAARGENEVKPEKDCICSEY